MFATLGTLIGGLGLFLLAISMITDGLRRAAGASIKTVLERWTTSRLRGVASGVLVTAAVQSSSAVTIATIGFVNAGLMSLGQALGVIYGANVGTTMTGWIVAVVGFSFRIEAFALPLIGLGMFAHVFRQGTRIGAIGGALAGFGLFFIGIDLMKGAFEVFAADFDLAGMELDGFTGLLLYVLLGILMTVLTQSSSAAIAITLTAATGGVLSLDAAAATVVGANLGTTSTAAFAVIGATANARRVAAAHVVFNVLTGAVALVLLAPMLWVVGATQDMLELEDAPAVSLALFHTVFNVLGVVIMWPLTTRLSRFLMDRFTTQAEILARPQYLDQNVLATPALALEALNLELIRAGAMTRDLVGRMLSDDPGASREARDRRLGVEALCDDIAAFVPRIETTGLAAGLKERAPRALRVVGYYEEVLGLLDEHESRRADISSVSVPSVADAIAQYRRHVIAHVQRADPYDADVAAGRIEGEYRELRAEWRALKTVLLDAASGRLVPIDRLNLALEGLRAMLRIAEQMTKAAGRTLELVDPAHAPAATRGVEASL